jgi:hypothetical protein
MLRKRSRSASHLNTSGTTRRMSSSLCGCTELPTVAGMPTCKCIVCQTPNTKCEPGVAPRGGQNFYRYDCPRCGSFALAENAGLELEGQLAQAPLRRSLMSHTLRRMQRPDHSHLHIITKEDLPAFWREERLPTPLEQADNLILWIGDNQTTPDVWAETTVPAIASTVGIAVSSGGNDSGAFGWLHSQLEKKQWYRQHSVSEGGKFRVMLEIAGWERYEALKKQRIESRFAFMALKFNQPKVGRMVQECARPAVARCGFELRILIDQQGAGLIDNQIRAALLSARFVISDLTQGSYGAYWEAGFGEGRGIPVIYTCEKGEWDQNKTHFDTNHMLTIIWDVDNLKRAENALVAAIRATLRAEATQTDDEDQTVRR